MYPFITVFGRDIPLYSVMLLLGIVAGLLVIYFMCRFKDEKSISRQEILYIAALSLAGGFTGAVLLRPVMKLPGLLIRWSQLPGDTSLWSITGDLFGEIVFYGGLLGGIITVIVLSRNFVKIPVLIITDLLVTGLSLGHAFGRIGCYLAGCCYGAEVSPGHAFAVTYPHSSLAAPAGISLLPVPLIEACCLIIICVLLITAYLKSDKQGLCTGLYFTLYGALRFVIEFFRGDLIRGIYGPFSTSQYISFGIVTAGIIILLRTTKNELRASSGEDV